MTENEKINGWTFEETVKTAENLMEAESNMFKWDVLRHLRDFAENYKDELEQYRAVGTVEELQKSIKEEDVLKFYYIESEDKYVVGKRLDNFYYAEVGKTGLAFYMSRYLPWGENGYPSEPKEITFFDWMQGFMKKEYGGTVEELKALKEKSVAKKPYLNRKGLLDVKMWHCPVCKKEVASDWNRDLANDYCHNCGQKLDWQ